MKLARTKLRDASTDLLTVVRNANGGGLDDGRLSDHLEWLIQAVDDGADVRADELPDADRAVSHALLRRLRSELIHRWSDAESPPPATEMLDLFRAFDKLEAALEPPTEHETLTAAAPRAFDLITEIAHDLRSPLTSILFLSETLWRGQAGDLTDVQHRQIGLIYSAALGLIGLIGDMIEYAHGGDVLAHTDPEPFSVADVFESVCRIVQPSAEEKGLTLRSRPPDEDRRIGHRVPLSRVLLNLTQNALKFTEEGFVEIAARPTGEYRLEFSVRDTGLGIDEATQDDLFRPLRRSEARESGHYFSGTALGLSICRRLIAAMGSDLLVETRPGRGTRFHFELDLPTPSAG